MPSRKTANADALVTTTSATAQPRRRRALQSVDNAIDAYVNALDGLPEEYLACREMMHPWRVTSNYHTINTAEQVDRLPRLGHTRYVERKLTCQRCGMVRSDAYLLQQWAGRTTLERLNSTYTAPEGYRLKGVQIQMSGRSELLRGLLYERMMESINHES